MLDKNKRSSLKVVTAQRQQPDEEAVRRKEEEIFELTPAEGRARAHEIRRYLEKLRDAVEGVPFAVVADEPSRSLRDIGDRSVSDLVEYLNPFLKIYRERCDKNLSADAYDGFLGDYFGFLIAGQAETGFAIGVLFCAMLYGASEQEIDKLERGFIHANALRWWYREGTGT